MSIRSECSRRFWTTLWPASPPISILCTSFCELSMGGPFDSCALKFRAHPPFFCCPETTYIKCIRKRCNFGILATTDRAMSAIHETLPQPKLEPLPHCGESFRHILKALRYRWCRSVVRNFGTLTQKNQLVFVEALFQHPNPQPFCETLWNVYHDASYGDTEVRDLRSCPNHSIKCKTV